MKILSSTIITTIRPLHTNELPHNKLRRHPKRHTTTYNPIIRLQKNSPCSLAIPAPDIPLANSPEQPCGHDQTFPSTPNNTTTEGANSSKNEVE